jgi:hypothetical protein
MKMLALAAIIMAVAVVAAIDRASAGIPGPDRYDPH